MNATNYDAQLAALREQIVQLRSKGSPARYPLEIKEQVAALRQAGLSSKRLANALGLGGSQIHAWCKVHERAAPRVFSVEAPPERVAVPMPRSRIQVAVGSWVLTLEAAEGV
jgi:hypothetical protein